MLDGLRRSFASGPVGNEAALVLTINSGSSSLRFALFAADSFSPALRGKIDRIGLPGSTLTLIEGDTKTKRELDAANHEACIPILLDLLNSGNSAAKIRAIGHRIVHGG